MRRARERNFTLSVSAACAVAVSATAKAKTANLSRGIRFILMTCFISIIRLLVSAGKMIAAGNLKK